MKAKGLENSIRKLCQEFRDVNYEKMNAFLRRTGSTEDTGIAISIEMLKIKCLTSYFNCYSVSSKPRL